MDSYSIFYCDACGDERAWPRKMVAVKGRCQVCGEEKLGSTLPRNLLPTAVHITGQLVIKFEDPNRPPAQEA